jgi:hypothetical protein
LIDRAHYKHSCNGSSFVQPEQAAGEKQQGPDKHAEVGVLTASTGMQAL